MADGGFLVKFEGEKPESFYCYAINLDYDKWKYVKNNKEKGPIPPGTEKITVVVEE